MRHQSPQATNLYGQIPLVSGQPPNTPLCEVNPMRKRNERIDVYFSEAELNVVKQKAKEAGLNCSELIRRAVLNKEVKQAPPADIPIMIRDIRRLGYNIDRLLKIADSTHLIDAPQMRKVLAQTWLMEQTIIDTFSKKG